MAHRGNRPYQHAPPDQHAPPNQHASPYQDRYTQANEHPRANKHANTNAGANTGTLPHADAHRSPYLELYGRGKIPVEQLDAKVDEVQGHLAALKVYRSGLIDEQHRADLWEREMTGVVEALGALQEKLDGGVTWEDKRTVVKLLVKGIRVETKTSEEGKRYAVAHVTYRFERPDVSEAPIPIELEPLFAGSEMAVSRQTHLRSFFNYGAVRYNGPVRRR